MHYQQKKQSKTMSKKIFIFTLLFITNNILSAQQQTKSSHYRLQYYALYTTRPANSFVEPIISCVISPSSMSIQHGELYYTDNNNKRLIAVQTEVSFTYEQYDHVMQHLKNEKPFCIEAHSPNKGFWQLFMIDPKQAKMKKNSL